jgi:hypothetical protein
MAPLFTGLAKNLGGYGFGRLILPEIPVDPFTLTTFQYNATSQKSRIYAFEVDGVLLTTYTGTLSSACGFNAGEPATNAFDGSYLTGAASASDACVMTWTTSLTINTQFRALVQMFPNQTSGSITFNGIPMTYDEPGINPPANQPGGFYGWWFKYTG